jgi:hypothetical protein
MKRIVPLTIDLEERARFYGVCSRTARRWHMAGADLHDPKSIGELLLRQRQPKPAVIENIRQIISSQP